MFCVVPTVYFGEPEVYVDESDGYVEVLVWRTGTDLSKPSTVTVQSKPSEPLSAECKNIFMQISVIFFLFLNCNCSYRHRLLNRV